MTLVGLLSWSALSLVVAWALYSWTCLLQNYLTARKVGIPIRILPISHGNPFWMIVDKAVISFFKLMPFGRSNFTRYNWRGWEIEDKCRSHLEMGDVYMQVDGAQWKKQRKITATCFNEQNNAIVWAEALSQATAMGDYWASKSAVKSTADDTRTLSLHVLSRAGFGRSFEFQGHDEKSANGLATNYKESLQIVLDNCVLIMALGTKFLSNPWLPLRLRRVHEACQSFQAYLTELYETEKNYFSDANSRDRTLMASLVRESGSEAKTSNGLTESEIFGNMFVFNFAGHDTTTHTLTFAIMYLAVNPSVQDWVFEEVDLVFGDRPVEEWNYEVDFPRLKRCLSVLMETVRLYTPVPVAKWTGDRVQSLEIGEQTITVPTNTMVIPSYAALHTHPGYWGSDSLNWHPARWIKSSDLPAATNDMSQEEIISPQRGTFIAWSEGDRSCPGKKFSQVESVATIAGLIRKWKVDPVVQSGEILEDARKRVLHLIETDSAQVLLLQMLHPDRAPLVWRKR
ncbi:hypothetical protein JX266_011197 [Neoarthrinium moseri]|nr:hypothetical protein JX266_011197 [Neoarthrinium moseri]